MDTVKKRSAVVWLALLLVWPCAAHALEYQDFRLENGLRVILVKENKAPVVISQVWYRVGSVDEKEGKTGLAHMLEHMMFQGTKDVPTGEFNRIVGQNGGENNASTAHDYTNYYIKFSSDRLDLALRLEADRMVHLDLREATFQSENRVVQEERRTRTDSDPDSRFLEGYNRWAYALKKGYNHPYGRPIIGWMSDIQKLTLSDLQDWYHTHYAPNHAVLIIVGDLVLEDAAQKVRHHFAGLTAVAAPTGPSNDQRRATLPPFPPPEREESSRLEITDTSATLPLWYAGYPVPTLSTAGKEDVFALDVLATILGSGSSSRLYKKLIVEEKLAVSASASYGGYKRGWEFFSLYAIPKPDTDKTTPIKPTALAAIEQAMLGEVTRLRQEQVDSRTLQRAKNSMIAAHIFSRDSIHHLASEIGLLSANDWDWLSIIEGYPQRIQAVTAQEVQKVAERYLRPERLIIGVLKP